MSKAVVLGILLVSLTVPIPLLAQEADNDVRIRVWAHFVSWYRQQEPGLRDNEWSDSSLFPIPPHRGAGVGEGYDSDDPDIIRLHNEDFIEYGITPLASWAGPGYFAGDDFYDAYLAIESPVQIGTLYEVVLLLPDTEPDNGTVDLFDFDNPVVAAKFVEDIRYLKSRYYDRYPHRFVKLDGKPVVFLWLTGLFRGDFEKAAAPIRDEVYLIGSEVGPYPPGGGVSERLPIIRGLDAISSYGVQFEDFHDGRMNERYAGQLLASFRLWSQWLAVHAPGVDIIPPLSFASNDTGIADRAPHAQPFFSSKEEASTVAEMYREFLSEIYDGCEVHNIPPMVNITSYNEIVEGTAMEATRRNPDVPQPFPEDFGHRYLEVVRDVLRQPIAYSERRCPQ